MSSNAFKLKIDAAFPGENVEKCLVASIYFVKGPVLEVKHSRDFEFHLIEFNLFTRMKKNASIATAVIKFNNVLFDDKPVSIFIHGNFEMAVDISGGNSTSRHQVSITGMPAHNIESVWLGINQPHLTETELLSASCFFDISSVILSRSIN